MCQVKVFSCSKTLATIHLGLLHCRRVLPNLNYLQFSWKTSLRSASCCFISSCSPFKILTVQTHTHVCACVCVVHLHMCMCICDVSVIIMPQLLCSSFTNCFAFVSNCFSIFLLRHVVRREWKTAWMQLSWPIAQLWI